MLRQLAVKLSSKGGPFAVILTIEREDQWWDLVPWIISHVRLGNVNDARLTAVVMLISAVLW